MARPLPRLRKGFIAMADARIFLTAEEVLTTWDVWAWATGYAARIKARWPKGSIKHMEIDAFIEREWRMLVYGDDNGRRRTADVGKLDVVGPHDGVPRTHYGGI